MLGHTVRILATGDKPLTDVELDRLRALIQFYGRMFWISSYNLEPRIVILEGVPGWVMGTVLEDLRAIITSETSLAL